MLLLITVSDKIQVITTSTATLHVHADYVDLSGTTVTPGRLNTIISSATTTDVVAAPGSSVQRNLQGITIYNAHATASNTVTVQHTDGTTVIILCKYTILVGESIFITETGEIIIMDAAGGLKLKPAEGRLLSITILSAGTSFTPGVGTGMIKLRMVGGGGQGGGALGGSSLASVGGGGGAGGYAEKLFSVSPSTSYSYTIGPGGSAQTTNVTGSAGTATTFTVGGVTVTASGGTGGIGAMAAASTVLTILGGDRTAVSTSGDVNGSGDPGGGGIRLSGTVAVSGEGASGIFGSGGNSKNTGAVGDPGVGFGAAGSGACSLTAVTFAGGAGVGGCIVVEEYS